jgi:hypothetical protein
LPNAPDTDPVYLSIYNQLKNLENSNQLTFPIPQAIVEVGTIDSTLGTFTYSVPTLVQTVVIAPRNDGGNDGENPGLPGNPAAGTGPGPIVLIAKNGPGGALGNQATLPDQNFDGPRTNTVVTTTVGVVVTNTVDLVLKFNIESLTGTAVIVEKTTAGIGRTAEVTQDTATSKPAVPPAAPGTSLPAITVTDSDSQFPTISSTATEILVDFGMACSVSLAQEAPNMDPAVSTFGLTIKIPGRPDLGVELIVARPPVLGMGAFTVPAFPMTIVYAPPQGKLAKNTATYSDTTTVARALATSINTSTSSKTVQAYSVSDIVGQVASALVAASALIGTGGAAGAAVATGSSSGTNALSAILSGLAAVTGVTSAATGGGSSTSAGAATSDPSFADNLKSLGNQLSAVNGVFGAFEGSFTPGGSDTLTTETDNTITVTLADTSMFSAVAGLGPGVGDRIVYISDLKLMWTAINGQVGISVLGFDSIARFAVQQLLQELTLLNNGQAAGSTDSKLDAATINTLLKLDPFTAPPPPRNLVEPPVIGSPRFVPCPQQPTATGGDTGSSPDTFVVSYDFATDDKTSTTDVSSTITDTKPGWVAVLYGAPNEDDTTTLVNTNNQSVDKRSDEKTTSTVTFVSAGEGDSYDVKFFYDRTFQTLLYVDADSPLLLGNPNTGTKTANA